MRTLLSTLVLGPMAVAVASCGAAPAGGTTAEPEEVASAAESLGTSIGAGGAFSCDFQLPTTMILQQVGPIIERDRMYMSARPGFIRKEIPWWVDAVNGDFDTGGRYLFTTKRAADNYFDWVVNDYVLDGTHFFDRSYFLNPSCHSWNVIGAVDFAPFPDAHVFVRTERYTAPAGNQTAVLKLDLPGMQAAAAANGYSGLWVLYSEADALVEITYFANRDIPNNPLVPDAVALETLALKPPLGAYLGGAFTQTFDRAQFVLTTWRPFVAGDQGPMSPWPSSPPLPGPSCGDGLCSPSRGENATSCAGDCPVHCGDAKCQAAEGEDTHTCPSDCRL